jgi:hypothetical protein
MAGPPYVLYQKFHLPTLAMEVERSFKEGIDFFREDLAPE